MNLNEQLKVAIELAISAHDGELDKHNERPFIEHPFRVMNAGQTLEEKIVGVLHDVIENTEWTLDQLREKGFSGEILDGVDAMSKRENEPYDDYMQRVLKNPVAKRVKMNDLTDNMDIRRLSVVGNEDIDRLNKYLKAYKQLTEQRSDKLQEKKE